MIYTSDLLLASIKTRAMIPSSQNTFQDSDLLNLANEEMETFIVGTLLRTQEEYLVVTDTVPTVVGQTRYRIPTRAIGGKLRDVSMVTSTGVRPVPRYIRENIPTNPQAISAFGFYIEGNYIVLLSSPNDNSASLLLSYFLRAGPSLTGLSINSAQLTTGIDSITRTNRLTDVVISAANYTGFSATTMKLTAGDVIRVHATPANGNGNAIRTFFRICKVNS